MKYSFAVAALVGLVSKTDVVTAINQKSETTLIESSATDSEMGRFINSKGQPINLAQTTGHFRLELQKIKKHTAPVDITNLELQACDNKQNLSQQKSKTDGKQKSETVLYDDVTHCPINKDGEKIQAHIVQQNLEDNAYISDMYVGNPPQKIRALFDTGSTNTWVLNKNTPLKNGATKQFSFDDSASKSAKKLAQSATIMFGSGSLQGHFMTDDVRIGSCDSSKSSGQIHIKDQKFGNVEQQKTIFTGNNFEAIVGMAYPALAEKNVTPVFDEMMKQNLLTSNMFAFYLTSKQAEEQGLKSDLTFGYYDKEKFNGDVHWNDVLYKYMYGVKLDDVKFNGKSTGVCKEKNESGENPCLITFDSGTSLMSVPKFAAKNFMENGIPTSNFVRKCKNQQQFGEMTLVIGGKDYNLSNEEWMFPAQKPNLAQGASKMKFSMGPLGPQIMTQIEKIPDNQFLDETEYSPAPDFYDLIGLDSKLENESDRKSKKMHLAHGEEGDGDMACASTIMTMDISKQMFLVGDVFMRKYYTIFDRDSDRVGLAVANTNDKIKNLSQLS